MAKKKITKKDAKVKIEELFLQAKEIFSKNKEKANLLVKKARKIAMKVRLRLPSHIKRSFCKYCNSYLVPGQNLRVRTQEGKLVYYCLECKRHWRMPYNTSKKVVTKKGQKQ